MTVDTNLVDDGFVVVPGVLTEAEIARLRSEVNAVLDERGINKHGSTTLPNAAALAPALSWVFCHDRILEAVRSLTGLDELTFTAEADLHRNFLLGIWHKDTGEASMENGYFDCDPTSTDDCRVYKVALYLQDHVDGSGLTVRPGTTTTMNLHEGSDYGIPIRAGDALVFDVRLTHRGMMATGADRVITKFEDVVLRDKYQKLPVTLRRWKYHITRHPERLAVYFAFGAPNQKSEVFAQRNMSRQLKQLGLDEFTLSPELTSRFESSNVRVASVFDRNSH